MKTHEESYRTSDLIKKMSELELVICGIGAIGSNLIDNIVRQGFKKIIAIDIDRVEEQNKQTQIWSQRDVGQLKTTAIKNHVFNIVNFSIETVYKKVESQSIKKILKTNGVVIDGFDNIESRSLVTKHCKENSIECLHIGLAEDYAEVIWNENYRVPNETNKKDICEYPLARNIILLAVSVATEVLITYISKKQKQNFIITLKDFKIQRI